MCDRVFINDSDIEIQTVDEFTEYFKPLVPLEMIYDDLMGNCCLCQIDIGVELSKLNLPYIYDGGDYFIDMPKHHHE